MRTTPSPSPPPLQPPLFPSSPSSPSNGPAGQYQRRYEQGYQQQRNEEYPPQYSHPTSAPRFPQPTLPSETNDSLPPPLSASKSQRQQQREEETGVSWKNAFDQFTWYWSPFRARFASMRYNIAETNELRKDIIAASCLTQCRHLQRELLLSRLGVFRNTINADVVEKDLLECITEYGKWFWDWASLFAIDKLTGKEYKYYYQRSTFKSYRERPQMLKDDIEKGTKEKKRVTEPWHKCDLLHVQLLQCERTYPVVVPSKIQSIEVSDKQVSATNEGQTTGPHVDSTVLHPTMSVLTMDGTFSAARSAALNRQRCQYEAGRLMSCMQRHFSFPRPDQEFYSWIYPYTKEETFDALRVKHYGEIWKRDRQRAQERRNARESKRQEEEEEKEEEEELAEVGSDAFGEADQGAKEEELNGNDDEELVPDEDISKIRMDGSLSLKQRP